MGYSTVDKTELFVTELSHASLIFFSHFMFVEMPLGFFPDNLHERFTESHRLDAMRKFALFVNSRKKGA